MITYFTSLNTSDITVKLDGKICGHIKYFYNIGKAYVPKGSKNKGKYYRTVDDVKRIIESK